MRRLNYLWRLAATGVAFAFIFFGGGVLAVALIPVLAFSRGFKRDRTQFLIHKIFGFYISTLQVLGLIRLQTEGLEKFDTTGGRLVIANHPSLLDVVLLMSMIPRAQCIIKHELWSHRFLGPLMRRAGYIRNDLDPEALVEACQASLASGDWLIIFPEGTRSTPGQPLRFRRGFANLATLTNASIQLVVITCDPPTLIKGEPWWRIPPHAPLFRLSVGDRLEASSYLGHAHRSIAARRLVQFLEAHYAEKLTNA